MYRWKDGQLLRDTQRRLTLEPLDMAVKDCVTELTKKGLVLFYAGVGGAC